MAASAVKSCKGVDEQKNESNRINLILFDIFCNHNKEKVLYFTIISLLQ